MALLTVGLVLSFVGGQGEVVRAVRAGIAAAMAAAVFGCVYVAPMWGRVLALRGEDRSLAGTMPWLQWLGAAFAVTFALAMLSAWFRLISGILLVMVVFGNLWAVFRLMTMLRVVLREQAAREGATAAGGGR